jgi:hypothetical protein
MRAVIVTAGFSDLVIACLLVNVYVRITIHGQRKKATRKNEMAKSPETDKAIERLIREREAYNTAKKTGALKAEEQAMLKLKESYKAGWQWAHTAEYKSLRNVAEKRALWVGRSGKPWGGHNITEFQAGAKAFFELLPKDDA